MVTFKSEDKNWRLEHDYKNLKDLDYQPDQSQQSDKLQLPKWVNVSKERFNEILRIVTEVKNNKLKTSTKYCFHNFSTQSEEILFSLIDPTAE